MKITTRISHQKKSLINDLLAFKHVNLTALQLLDRLAEHIVIYGRCLGFILHACQAGIVGIGDNFQHSEFGVEAVGVPCQRIGQFEQIVCRIVVRRVCLCGPKHVAVARLRHVVGILNYANCALAEEAAAAGAAPSVTFEAAEDETLNITDKENNPMVDALVQAISNQ